MMDPEKHASQSILVAYELTAMYFSEHHCVSLLSDIFTVIGIKFNC